MLLATACGCAPSKSNGGGGSSEEGSTTSSATASDASSSTSSSGQDSVDSGTSTSVHVDMGASDESSTGGPPGVDCNDLPELPVLTTVVRTIPGAEDIEFDAHGNVVVPVRGENSLWLYPREGDGVLLNPNINLASTAGTSILPDGDIVVSDEAQALIARVDPDTGQMTPIVYGANGISGCNGLTVGSDGMMYGASYGSGVVRIDPDTAEAEVIWSPGGSFGGIDGIAFSATEEYLYFNEGEIFQMGDGSLFRGLFADGMVSDVEDLGPPLAGSQGTIDGMTTDVCGNVYIATQNVNSPLCAGSSTVRVAPDGGVEIVACLGNAAFTPAIAFGSGVGGWDRDKLYVGDWGGELYELPVGVPGQPLPHL